MNDNEITMKNTKAEIIEALNDALKRAEEAEKGKLNPERHEKAQAEKKAVETAKRSVEENIFSKELIGKFNDLQTAINVEENRLQELYGVGRELQKLALVIESGHERQEKIEAERLQKSEEAKSELKELDLTYNQKSAALQAEYDEAGKKLKLERARENEEFQYNLSRTREKENNAWLDEKTNREAALKKREEEAAALLAEAEGKAGYTQSLEEKVDGFTALLEGEKQVAIEQVTKSLQQEFEYSRTLAEKDAVNAIDRAEDKIKYLTSELEAAQKALNTMQGKLDKAYAEMRDLATKTVESASGVKIIGNKDFE